MGLFTQHAYSQPFFRQGGRWRELVKGCPVCGHLGWCRVSPDGSVAACRRLEEGAFRAVEYRDGTAAYLHSLDGTRRVPPDGFEVGACLERAPDADLDAVYRALLSRLTLSPAHRAGLLARGLSAEWVGRALYRSLPGPGRAAAAGGLRDRFPDELLLRVPGLVRREGERGGYLSLAGRPGLLVPVRDPRGLLVALVVRPDDPPPGSGKYAWLSSRRQGGAGPSGRTHVPPGAAGATPSVPGRVVLVEGQLKADVVFALSGRPVVGLAGASVTRDALATLHALGCAQPLLALDSDHATNPDVARARRGGYQVLRGHYGDRAGLLDWPPEAGKGLDDVLWGMKRKTGGV